MTPISLIALPMAMAPVIYFVRRISPLAASLSLVTTLVAMGLCLLIPLNEPATILGRELVLDYPGRLALPLIFAMLAITLLYAGLISQGWSFFPFVIFAMGLISGTILIRNFLIAVLLLEIASLVMVFLIQSGRPGSVQAASRYLVLIVLAAPCLLLASWLIDLYTLNPDNLSLIRYIVLLFTIGFGILLAVVPFHLWLPVVAEEAPAMVTTLLISAASVIAFYLLIGLLNRSLWLTTESQALSILTFGGLLTALIGGILALSQRSISRLLAYSAVSDLGYALVGLGTASTLGTAGALLHMVNRSLSVTLVAMCLGAIRYHVTSDSLVDLRGVADRMPLTTIGFIVGGLALSGFPLSNGFAARWLIYRALFENNSTHAYALMAASGMVLLGYLRAIRVILGTSSASQATRESVFVALLIALLAMLSLILGLYPQFILKPICAMVESFTFIQSP